MASNINFNNFGLNLYEDIDGQYSLFDMNNNADIEMTFNYILDNTKNLLKQIGTYKNSSNMPELETKLKKYITLVFEQLSRYSLEDIEKNFDDEEILYHQISKIFLFYLSNFIYNINEENALNDEKIIKIEKFILNDAIKFKNPYYRNIKEIILRRQSLRINNYVVLDLKPKMLELLKAKNNNSSKVMSETDLKDFLETQDMIALENKQISAIALAYQYQFVKDPVVQEKIEYYIISNYPSDYILSAIQHDLIELIKFNFGLRVKKYVEVNYSKIYHILEEYDRLEQLRDSGKKRAIVASDVLSSLQNESSFAREELPEVLTYKELETVLKEFLQPIFFPQKGFLMTDLPLWIVDEEKTAFNNASIILLEYLDRFVYKPKLDVNNNIIATLEEYISKNTSLQAITGRQASTRAIINFHCAQRNILGRVSS